MVNQKEKFNYSTVRVLVVEDNTHNQRLLTGLLNALGIVKIAVASDGVEGLDKAAELRPHLIVLDYYMPRLDGIGFLQQIRSTPGLYNVPVIIQSSIESHQARENLYNYGATDFINKPIIPLEFFNRIQTHLDKFLLLRQNRQLREKLSLRAKQSTTPVNDTNLIEELRHLLPDTETLTETSKQLGLNCLNYYEPSTKPGSSFWGLKNISKGCAAFYLYDYNSPTAPRRTHTVRIHTLLDILPPPDPKDPASYIQKINNYLVDHIKGNSSAGFFVGIVNTATKHLTYAAAGVPTPIVGAQGSLKLCTAGDPPMGITKNVNYRNFNVRLPDDWDFIFLYSRVMRDSPQKNNTPFGQKALLRLVDSKYKNNSGGKGLFNEILDSFLKNTVMPLHSDMACCWLENTKRTF